MDSFEPDTNIPSLQLKAKVLNQQQVQELEYVLKLKGAKKPKNELLVEVELQETTHGMCTETSNFPFYCTLSLYSVDSSFTQQALVPSHGTFNSTVFLLCV